MKEPGGGRETGTLKPQEKLKYSNLLTDVTAFTARQRKEVNWFGLYFLYGRGPKVSRGWLTHKREIALLNLPPDADRKCHFLPTSA